MNILLALTSLRSEAEFQNASPSVQTVRTCLAESAESSLVCVDEALPFGEVHFIPGKAIG